MSTGDTPCIEFEVGYRLSEYKAFVRGTIEKRMPELSAQTGRSASSLMHRSTMALLMGALPLVFLYKRLRIGSCHFYIDATQIRRTSKLGEVVVPWSTVQSVFECSPGLLMIAKNGALPVPSRVLTAEQDRQLRGIIGAQGLTIA